MTQTYFFQYNIPADNNYLGTTDRFINVLVQWNGNTYSTDSRPIVNVKPVIFHSTDLRMVKNWDIALDEMEKIGEKHFADEARQKKIQEAKDLLALSDNPVLDRYSNIDPFFTEIITNHFTPVS